MIDRLPPLNSLKAFEAAARHMSFQKAAAELNVTPAALSYQIRQLEDLLGIKLFKRLNRAVELSREGALIEPGIREGFERLSQAMRRLKRSRAGNVLTISAGPALTAKWLVPRLYRFIARHPEIDARISATMQLADLVHDDVDIAFRFGRGQYDACRSVKLFDEYVTPLCAPALLDKSPGLQHPSDLASYTLIHDDTHIGLFDLADWPTWLKAAGVDNPDGTREGLHFNIADDALNVAVAGAGVVLGRTALAQSDIDAGRLVAPFDLKIKAEFSFYAVCLESRADEPFIAAFRNWLLEEAAGQVDEPAIGPAV
ncbi:MAG: transcriptional regulator GcvA [marine bacterium B5-7]|nr:MAG: transcriptional regulator GcvA [marine bacterium B5-7]